MELSKIERLNSQYFRAEELLPLAKEAEKHAKKLANQCETLASTCENLNQICTEDMLWEDKIERASNDVDKELTKARHSIFNLYKRMFATLTWGGTRAYDKALVSDYLQFNEEIEGVEAFVEDNMLLIKLPMLCEKSARKCTAKGEFMPDDYYDFFCNSLEAALLLLSKSIPTFDIRNIQYSFVYPENSVNILDSDNHDTKKITDTIASFMLGGDSAKACSFSYQTIETNELPEGTYVTVSEPFGKNPNWDAILTKWKQQNNS